MPKLPLDKAMALIPVWREWMAEPDILKFWATASNAGALTPEDAVEGALLQRVRFLETPRQEQKKLVRDLSALLRRVVHIIQ